MSDEEKLPDAKHKQEALTGHTSLCLMSLLGFVLYTSTYSVVYLAKTGGKPVAVIEMWMVLTHLFASVSTCVLNIMTMTFLNTSVIAKAQSALFFGVALTVTGIGTACFQDTAFCSVYYPAAGIPVLAAAGSIAWAWVMYIASLGCQSSRVMLSLGLGSREAITAAGLMGLIPPHVLSKVGVTCGIKWQKLFCTSAVGGACNTALCSTTVVVASLLSYTGHFLFTIYKMQVIGGVLQLASVLFLWADLFAVLAVGSKTMVFYQWSMGLLTLFPIVSVILSLVKGFSSNPPSSSSSSYLHSTQNIGKTGIRFPILDANAFHMNSSLSAAASGRYHIL